MAKQKFNFQLTQPATQPMTVSGEQGTNAGTVASIVQRLDNNDKNPFEIKLVPRNRIRMNKKNSYPIEDIDSLAKSILEFGLQQNLVVVYESEEDMYIIETGHRRATALNMLIDKYSGNTDYPDYDLYMKNVAPYEKGFPCRVIYLEDGIEYDVSGDTDLSTIPTSVIDSEIRLYITNEEIRAKNPARTAQAIARLKQLYDAKNAALNHSDKINVNNEIAKNLNISPRQVAKYNSIENLIPELQSLFINNNITLSSASSYSQLTPDDQKQIYQIFKTHEDLNTRQINELIQSNQELNQQIKKQEAAIENLSSNHNATGGNNDEVLKLKKQINDLKAQQKTILTENSELKSQMLAKRSLKITYDSLVSLSSRFIKEATEYSASELSCDSAKLERALSLLTEISELDLF